MLGKVKGASFETEITVKLSVVKDSVCIPHVKVYSHFLGTETEVDNILLTPWKFYCVEAKSFTTSLEGNLGDYEWIGNSWGKRTVIYNPVSQNFEHIRSLNSYLKRVLGKFFRFENIIVVPDSCLIKSNYPNVMTISDFMSRIVMDSSYALSNLDYTSLEEVIRRLSR